MQERAFGRRREDVVPPDVARIDRDDEVNFVDLWLVVRRWWPWLLAGLLASIIGAAAYVVLTTPTYESRALVQIGSLPETGPIDNVGALAAQLLYQYGAYPGDGAESRIPYLKEAAAERGNSGMLKLTSVGHSPDETRKLLTQITAALVQRHEQVYESAVNPIRERLTTITREVALLRAQAAELDELTDRLKEAQPAQAALAAIERARLHQELNDLERDRVELLQKFMQPYSKPTRVIAPAALPLEPATPRTAVAVVIAVVLGIILGLLAVLSREFFSRAGALAGSNTNNPNTNN